MRYAPCGAFLLNFNAKNSIEMLTLALAGGGSEPNSYFVDTLQVCNDGEYPDGYSNGCTRNP